MEENGAAPPRKPLPPPNPVTQAAYKRDVSRQVMWPLALGVVVLGGLAAAFAYYGVGTLEKWAQISTMVLIALFMIVGLIVLVVLAGIAFLVTRILQLLPPYARLAQQAIDQINQQIKSGAQVSVGPVIRLQSFMAMVEALFGKK